MLKNGKKVRLRCDNCNKKIVKIPSLASRSHHHFCSQKCYHSYKWKNLCLNCNKMFKSVKPVNKFCSRICWEHYIKENGTLTKRGTYIKLNCLVCNKKFYKAKRHIKRDKSSCCSIKCKRVHWSAYPIKKKKNVLVKCLNCGKTFFTKTHKIRKYCSQECFNNMPVQVINKVGEITSGEYMKKCRILIRTYNRRC